MMPCFFYLSQKVTFPTRFPLFPPPLFAMSHTILEACELLECTPPLFFKRIEVDVCTEVNDQEQVSIEVYCRTTDRESDFEVIDRLSYVDVDAWRRLGRAFQDITLDELSLGAFLHGERADEIDDDLVTAAERCVNAFMAEVKHNKTIIRAYFELTGLWIDDLSDFIQYNDALEQLMLESEELVTLEQSNALSQAISIRSVQLKEVIFGCCFENDGSLDRMMEGCSRVDDISFMCCSYISECTAVAAFLRDTTNSNVVRKLLVQFIVHSGDGALSIHSGDGDLSTLDREQAVRDIAASLVKNTHLKELSLYGLGTSDWFDRNKLICDVSSIETIVNSNHTLEGFSNVDELSTLAEQCLVLNRNPDKTEVIREKIRRFYFVGDFDMSPFVDVPLCVLPEVMSQIDGEDKLSAIYKLLQYIPDLLNISVRVSSEQNTNKRLKMI
jgi:hypothetical protein